MSENLSVSQLKEELRRLGATPSQISTCIEKQELRDLLTKMKATAASTTLSTSAESTSSSSTTKETSTTPTSTTTTSTSTKPSTPTAQAAPAVSSSSSATSSTTSSSTTEEETPITPIELMKDLPPSTITMIHGKYTPMSENRVLPSDERK